MNGLRIAVGTLISIILATDVQSQSQRSVWTFGGKNGLAWTDWVELNVLTDDRSVPGSLQALELQPHENLLPILNRLQPFTFEHKPLDPFWMEGTPRIWQFAFNFDRNSDLPKLIDGIDSTYDPRRTIVSILEYFTMDMGGLVPLERFVLTMPPESEIDPSGTPYTRYVPEHSELSASQNNTQILRESSVPYDPYWVNDYVPLDSCWEVYQSTWMVQWNSVSYASRFASCDFAPFPTS